MFRSCCCKPTSFWRCHIFLYVVECILTLRLTYLFLQWMQVWPVLQGVLFLLLVQVRPVTQVVTLPPGAVGCVSLVIVPPGTGGAVPPVIAPPGIGRAEPQVVSPPGTSVLCLQRLLMWWWGHWGCEKAASKFLGLQWVGVGEGMFTQGALARAQGHPHENPETHLLQVQECSQLWSLVVVYKHHSQVGLLVTFLLWKMHGAFCNYKS